MAVGLLILRVALGALLTGHGTQKAAGWFGGPGLAAAARLFDQWGFSPGLPLAALAAACELTAGLLLIAGLATPLAAAITIGTMSAAAAPNARNGLWAARNGFELPLVYGITGTALGFTGAGTYSVDHLIHTPAGAAAGIAAVLLGIAASALPLTARRSVLRARAQAPTPSHHPEASR